MAKIDYKEKYEQALERARQFFEKPYLEDSAGIVGYIFPELAESEDERIRKAMIDFFKHEREEGITVLHYGVNIECMIAWLEKQGENPITLPKWKYKKDNVPLLRDSLILNKYGCVAKSPSGAHISDVWVLDYDELVKLPKEELEKKDEQKPAWSEEDETMITLLHNIIDHHYSMDIIKKEEQLKLEDWLKFLKYRVQPQPRQEWSEEDDRMYNRIVSFIPQHLTAESYTACINWLKSLRPQNTWKPSEEQMKALYDSIPEDVKEISEREMLLNELYKDLRKEYFGR